MSKSPSVELYLHADGRTASIEFWSGRGNCLYPGGRVSRFDPKREVERFRKWLGSQGFSLVQPEDIAQARS
jgi:hypothetical protein